MNANIKMKRFEQNPGCEAESTEGKKGGRAHEREHMGKRRNTRRRVWKEGRNIIKRETFPFPVPS